MSEPLHELLIAVGKALYGDRWQSPLARDLGVGDRRVREWIARERTTPPGIRIDLMRLCLERAQDLDELAEKLKDTSGDAA